MLYLAGTKKSSPFEAADPWFDGVLAQNVLRRLSGVLDKILLDQLSDLKSQLDPLRVSASATQHALVVSCTEEIASPESAIEHAAGYHLPSGSAGLESERGWRRDLAVASSHRAFPAR